MEPHQPFIESTPSMGLFRNKQEELVGDRERSQIQHLVVQRAEAEAVSFFVRPACLVPFDVSRFDPQRIRSNADIEIADRTTVFVSRQYAGSESGITLPALRVLEYVQLQPHGVKNVSVE